MAQISGPVNISSYTIYLTWIWNAFQISKILGCILRVFNHDSYAPGSYNFFWYSTDRVIRSPVWFLFLLFRLIVWKEFRHKSNVLLKEWKITNCHPFCTLFLILLFRIVVYKLICYFVERIFEGGVIENVRCFLFFYFESSFTN